MHDVEVAVVGAGPTGLMLAGDLAEAGLRVVVLEKREAESNLARAFAVHARTLEHLDMRGLADELIDTGSVLPGIRAYGGLDVDLSDLPTRFPFVLITPQFNTEDVLVRRAVEHGARILRGHEVVGMSQDADGVTLQSTRGDPVRASYAVGCDGHASAMRELAGLPFPGRSVVRSLMLADVRMSEPPPGPVLLDSNEHGFVLLAPFGDGWFRVIAKDHAYDRPESEPLELDELVRAVRKVHGTDLGITETRFLNRFHTDERIVPSYRTGRVFLAGDAAHAHSPAGGMGMNTGLQDAANLSWKLAAVLHGEAEERLLDSYHDERHPVGRLVTRLSGGLLRSALVRSPTARRARNVFGSIGLHMPIGPKAVKAVVAGLAVGYTTGTGLGVPGRPGAQARDYAGVDGGRLYETLRQRKHVLVAPPGSDTSDWSGPVLVSSDVRRPLRVRPDGHLTDGQMSRWKCSERPTGRYPSASLTRIM